MAVIQEAWISGISTRKVDDLVQAMGLTGSSKSTVSKLCKNIDDRVHASLDRPLTDEWPYLWLDATYLKVRQGERIISVAPIIAVAANTDGRREIIDLCVGPSEAETVWTESLSSLKGHGLDSVKLVISDAHTGLKAAIGRVFDASWHRYRVHWMRKCLRSRAERPAQRRRGRHPAGHHQPDQKGAIEIRRHVADERRPRWPKLASLMDESAADVLAYMALMAQHRTKLHSTEPLSA